MINIRHTALMRAADKRMAKRISEAFNCKYPVKTAVRQRLAFRFKNYGRMFRLK